jgi:hypothetical protein
MKCRSLNGKLYSPCGCSELRCREEMYRGGGLFSVTSKILVNDFLSAYDFIEYGVKLTYRGDRTC